MLCIDNNGVLRYTDDILTHHGVKGMKWGVRRYRNKDGTLTAEGRAREEQRVDKWRKREVRKIANRQLKRLNKDGKRIDKAAKKFETEFTNYGSTNKAYKLAGKYVKAKANAMSVDNISRAEAARVLKMNMSDVKTERKVIGKKVVEASLLNLLNVPFRMLGSPVAVVNTVNVSKVKTNSRVDFKTQAAIIRQAYEDAAKDVYG